MLRLHPAEAMIPPLLPPDERPRLADLHRLRILDTPPEERFDRVTRLATTLLDVPIALVSLVDSERQWFKSRQGLPDPDGPRETSFCGHAIVDDAPLFEVPDATLDPRFHDNPSVIGGPRVRWYVGRPLKGLAGYRVGTLCLLDRKPRVLTPRERQAIEDLGSLVETELHLVRLAEMQEDLVAATRNAEAASRAKSAFLAYVSHEIRTPVTSIGAAVELLEQSPLSSVQQRYVGFYKRGADALLELVDNLLDLSAAEAGRLQLEATDFDLTELVQGLLGVFEARALTKRVGLRAVIDPTLPPMRRGDHPRLRQVLLNLVGNALKFTATGEVVVHVKGHPDPDRVSISVVDTGPGIPPERLDAVFESFIQADPAVRRKHGGTGLGLAIVKGIVEAMGGQIRVTSDLGVGSTFSFTVPLPRARGPARLPAS